MDADFMLTAAVYVVTFLIVIIFVGVIGMLIDYVNRPEKVTCFYCKHIVPFEDAYESKISIDGYVCEDCKNKLGDEA